ncbi:MAG: DoxX family protein, partial [Acidimicrobiales bacterium]
ATAARLAARRLPEATAVRVRPVVWTVAAGVLALVMAGAGLAKLTGDGTFAPVFDALGLPGAVAVMVGSIELGLAAAVLWRRTRTVAAAGIVVLMVLALGAGLVAGEPRFLITNLMVGAAAALIVKHAVAPVPAPSQTSRGSGPDPAVEGSTSRIEEATR